MWVMDFFHISAYKSTAITSWPFGPALSVFRCGQCFGMVSVLVQPVYKWGRYLRSLSDCCSPARLMIQFYHCYLYLGHLSYFHNKNIKFRYKSTAQKHWPYWNIECAMFSSKTNSIVGWVPKWWISGIWNPLYIAIGDPRYLSHIPTPKQNGNRKVHMANIDL